MRPFIVINAHIWLTAVICNIILHDDDASTRLYWLNLNGIVSHVYD